ncbi:MAG TPA: hypothetical protein VM364_04465 [Vicinamibacterales bacterium]|nr:hypothetical protein [Vicinamibacterales bacterium]
MRLAAPASITAFWIAFALASAASLEKVIVIAVEGEPPPALLRGVEFGVAEMAVTAQLLGREVTLTRDGSDVSGVVAAGERPAGARRDVPTIHVGTRPANAGACDFSIAATRSAEGAGETIVLWHATLDRYGASELNDRYTRQYGEGMTGDAWAGWAAVKALVESALRRLENDDPCAALGRLRFDGHKGRALTFDPDTRILSQPLYIVRNGRVTGEVK